MIITTFSAPPTGPTATLVTIQFRMDRGLQAHISGIRGTAAKDLLVKLRQTFAEQKLHWPRGAMTWHLMPSAAFDAQAGLDLGLALGLLAASGTMPVERLRTVGSIGLLGLTGDIAAHPDWNRWVLEDEAIDEWLVPANWRPEVLEVPPHVRLHPVSSLREAIDHLKGHQVISPVTFAERNNWKTTHHEQGGVDFEDLDGEWDARLGLCLAVIGHHPTILIGGPGTGKSMCARILHGLLPLMSPQEGHAVRKRHAARGIVHDALLVPPFRSPHTGSSAAGMFGHCPDSKNGIAHLIPGEVTLAHHGVLCLDEFTEFSRSVIEGLRTVLDQGQVAIARAHGAVRLPANPLLVITSNPCACGHRFDPEIKRCRCTTAESRRYFQRIRGPVLDRLAIHLETGSGGQTCAMTAQDKDDLSSSSAARLRIQAATDLKRSSPRKSRPQIEPLAMKLLETAAKQYRWSLRAKGSVRQVAASHMWWRLAAAPGPKYIRKSDMEAAINLRIFDRSAWLDMYARKQNAGKHASEISKPT
jgi:magnesium chelatase family protein